ncbi:DNA helicase mcm9 [Sarracenia purpurea var. burkii]
MEDAALKDFAQYLIRHHSDQLRSIILSPDPRLHYSLYVDFADLMDDHPPLAYLLFSNPINYLRLFNEATISAQKDTYGDFNGRNDASLKEHVHVRINVSGSPLECQETFPSIRRIRVRHHGILLTLKGTVIRSGSIKMIEGEGKFVCRKCKHSFKVYPELETGCTLLQPSSCPSQGSKFCEGTSFLLEGNRVCHDYQEIKLQESTQVLDVGAIPRSIPVILKDDLADIVKAGGITLYEAHI